MNKSIGALIGLSMLVASMAPAQAQLITKAAKGAAQAVSSDAKVAAALGNLSGQVDRAVVRELVNWGVLSNLQDPLINMRSNPQAQAIIGPSVEQLVSRHNFNAKFWERNPSLWSNKADVQDFIVQYLGWQKVYDWTLSHLDEINAFAQDAKQHFDHCIVMGMGGSSLAPEVFRQVFGKQAGWPELIVLDTTNPDTISSVLQRIDPKRTLFIYASKSGGTVEPASQYAYFSSVLAQQGVEQTGRNFVAITDKGTSLEKLAQAQNFRHIFLNPADVGGRFSALSMFGIVPAAVMGIDVQRLLVNAQENAKLFGPAVPSQSNVALHLGALMGASNHRKMILLMPKKLEVLGLWIEQLVAESLGKEGQGVIPVTGEKMHMNFAYSPDQFFVRIDMHTPGDGAVAKVANNLSGRGVDSYPVFTMDMTSPYQLGSMMLAWEVATAAAGAQLHINPFDQPNVQAAKKMTQELLAQLKAGQLPQGINEPVLVSRVLEGRIDPANLTGEAFYDQINPGDYVSILPYLNPTQEVDAALAQLRDVMVRKTHRAVTLGYGPRYLHSTGQLHKGGRNQGVFLILSADPVNDVQIPGQDYTFGQLSNAQALGDFRALEDNGRRAIRIHLDSSVPLDQAIKRLTELFK